MKDYVIAGSPEMIGFIEALGLKDKRVTSCVLRLGMDDPATLEVEYAVNPKEIDMKKLKKTFRLCRLEEIEGAG
jgi:hypothetical protein